MKTTNRSPHLFQTLMTLSMLGLFLLLCASALPSSAAVIAPNSINFKTGINEAIPQQCPIEDEREGGDETADRQPSETDADLEHENRVDADLDGRGGVSEVNPDAITAGENVAPDKGPLSELLEKTLPELTTGLSDTSIEDAGKASAEEISRTAVEGAEEGERLASRASEEVVSISLRVSERIVEGLTDSLNWIKNAALSVGEAVINAVVDENPATVAIGVVVDLVMCGVTVGIEEGTRQSQRIYHRDSPLEEARSIVDGCEPVIGLLDGLVQLGVLIKDKIKEVLDSPLDFQRIIEERQSIVGEMIKGHEPDMLNSIKLADEYYRGGVNSLLSLRQSSEIKMDAAIYPNTKNILGFPLDSYTENSCSDQRQAFIDGSEAQRPALAEDIYQCAIGHLVVSLQGLDSTELSSEQLGIYVDSMNQVIAAQNQVVAKLRVAKDYLRLKMIGHSKDQLFNYNNEYLDDKRRVRNPYYSSHADLEDKLRSEACKVLELEGHACLLGEIQAGDSLYVSRRDVSYSYDLPFFDDRTLENLHERLVAKDALFPRYLLQFNDELSLDTEQEVLHLQAAIKLDGFASVLRALRKDDDSFGRLSFDDFQSHVLAPLSTRATHPYLKRHPLIRQYLQDMVRALIQDIPFYYVTLGDDIGNVVAADVQLTMPVIDNLADVADGLTAVSDAQLSDAITSVWREEGSHQISVSRAWVRLQRHSLNGVRRAIMVCPKHASISPSGRFIAETFNPHQDYDEFHATDRDTNNREERWWVYGDYFHTLQDMSVEMCGFPVVLITPEDVANQASTNDAPNSAIPAGGRPAHTATSPFQILDKSTNTDNAGKSNSLINHFTIDGNRWLLLRNGEYQEIIGQCVADSMVNQRQGQRFAFALDIETDTWRYTAKSFKRKDYQKLVIHYCGFGDFTATSVVNRDIGYGSTVTVTDPPSYWGDIFQTEQWRKMTFNCGADTSRPGVHHVYPYNSQKKPYPFNDHDINFNIADEPEFLNFNVGHGAFNGDYSSLLSSEGARFRDVCGEGGRTNGPSWKTPQGHRVQIEWSEIRPERPNAPVNNQLESYFTRFSPGLDNFNDLYADFYLDVTCAAGSHGYHVDDNDTPVQDRKFVRMYRTMGFAYSTKDFQSLGQDDVIGFKRPFGYVSWTAYNIGTLLKGFDGELINQHKLTEAVDKRFCGHANWDSYGHQYAGKRFGNPLTITYPHPAMFPHSETDVTEMRFLFSCSATAERNQGRRLSVIANYDSEWQGWSMVRGYPRRPDDLWSIGEGSYVSARDLDSHEELTPSDYDDYMADFRMPFESYTREMVGDAVVYRFCGLADYDQQFVDLGNRVRFHIKNRDDGTCLGQLETNNPRVGRASCNDPDARISWQIESPDDFDSKRGSRLQLRVNSNDTQCLQQGSGSVFLASCSNSTNQLWSLASQISDSRISLFAEAGQCLAASATAGVSNCTRPLTGITPDLTSIQWDLVGVYAGNKLKMKVSQWHSNIRSDRPKWLDRKRMQLSCGSRSQRNRDRTFTFYQQVGDKPVYPNFDNRNFERHENPPLWKDIDGRYFYYHDESQTRAPNTKERLRDNFHPYHGPDEHIHDYNQLYPMMVDFLCGPADFEPMTRTFDDSSYQVDYSPTTGVLGDYQLQCAKGTFANSGRSIRVSDYNSNTKVARPTREIGHFPLHGGDAFLDNVKAEGRALLRDRCGSINLYQNVMLDVRSIDDSVKIYVDDRYVGERGEAGFVDIMSYMRRNDPEIRMDIRNGGCFGWNYDIALRTNNIQRTRRQGSRWTGTCGQVASTTIQMDRSMISTEQSAAALAVANAYSSVELDIRSIDDTAKVYVDGDLVRNTGNTGIINILPYLTRIDADIRIKVNNGGCFGWNYDVRLRTNGHERLRRNDSSRIGSCGQVADFTMRLDSASMATALSPQQLIEQIYSDVELDVRSIDDSVKVYVDGRFVTERHNTARINLKPYINRPNAEIRLEIRNGGCYGWNYDIRLRTNGRERLSRSGSGGWSTCGKVADTTFSLNPETMGNTSQANSYRELRNRHEGSNLCLDVTDGSNSNGQRIQIYSCNGSNAQKWRYDLATGFLRNKMGKCLDISGNDTNVRNGQRVQLWSCSATAEDQKWDYSEGVFRNRVNRDIVMDARGYTSGVEVGLWERHTGTNQVWTWNN